MIHTVKAGETLSSIAEDYLQSIIQANPQINPNIIYVGQRITDFPNEKAHSLIRVRSNAEYHMLNRWFVVL